MNKAGRKILKRLMRNLADPRVRIRQGDEIKLLCPYHGEKTPSFSVNRRDGRYKCYGCGITGNIYKLAKQHPYLLGRKTAKEYYFRKATF